MRAEARSQTILPHAAPPTTGLSFQHKARSSHRAKFNESSHSGTSRGTTELSPSIDCETIQSRNQRFHQLNQKLDELMNAVSIIKNGRRSEIKSHRGGNPYIGDLGDSLKSRVSLPHGHWHLRPRAPNGHRYLTKVSYASTVTTCHRHNAT